MQMLALLFSLGLATSGAMPPEPCAAGPLMVGQASPSSYVEAFREGCDALDRGDAKAALSRFDQCLALAPESPTLAFYIACAQARAGERDAALASIERAVEFGYDDAGMARFEPDLTVLRTDPRFTASIARMQAAQVEHAAEKHVHSVEWTDTLLVHGPTIGPAPSQVFLPCRDGSVRLFELDSGRILSSWKLSRSWISSVSVAPSGDSFIAVDGDYVGTIVDVSGKSGVHTLSNRAKTQLIPYGTGISSRGDRLITYGNGPVMVLYSYPEGNLIADLVVDGEGIWTAAWSPDSSCFATAGENGNVRIWEGDSGKLRWKAFAHPHGVVALDFDPSGKMLATGGRDAKAALWDARTGTPTHALSYQDYDHFGDLLIGRVRFARDGLSVLTTSGAFGNARLWDVETGVKQWEVDFEGGNPGTINACFSKDGKRIFLAGMVPAFSRVVDAADGHTLVDLRAQDIICLETSPDEKFVLGWGRIGPHWKQQVLLIFDSSTLDLLYTRGDYPNDSWLAQTPTMYADGTPDAWRKVNITVDAETYELESFASILCDPKKLRARCAGISITNAVLPNSPQVTLVSPKEASVVSSAAEIAVEVEARDARGVIGFVVERNGRVVPSGYKTDGGPQATARLSILVPLETDGATAIRIHAIGASGVLSRPQIVTVKRPA